MMRSVICMLALTAALAAQPKVVLRPKGRPAARIGQLEKFSRMTPDERKRVIEKLPPERQKQIERNVESYNKLSDSEKRNLLGQLEHFNSLPAADQQRARRLLREVNQMSTERRTEVRREMARLRRMTEEGRKARLESEDFKGKYSSDERRVIGDLVPLFETPER